MAGKWKGHNITFTGQRYCFVNIVEIGIETAIGFYPVRIPTAVIAVVKNKKTGTIRFVCGWCR